MTLPEFLVALKNKGLAETNLEVFALIERMTGHKNLGAAMQAGRTRRQVLAACEKSEKEEGEDYGHV